MLRRRDARAAFPDVGESSWDPGRGLLVVLTDDPDTVLRRALGGGWSFVAGSAELVRS